MNFRFVCCTHTEHRRIVHMMCRIDSLSLTIRLYGVCLPPPRRLITAPCAISNFAISDVYVLLWDDDGNNDTFFYILAVCCTKFLATLCDTKSASSHRTRPVYTYLKHPDDRQFKRRHRFYYIHMYISCGGGETERASEHAIFFVLKTIFHTSRVYQKKK